LRENPALVEELKARVKSGLQEESKEIDYKDQEGIQSWTEWFKDPETQKNLGSVFGWKATLPI